jgi:hypothetical protein
MISVTAGAKPCAAWRKAGNNHAAGGLQSDLTLNWKETEQDRKLFSESHGTLWLFSACGIDRKQSSLDGKDRARLRRQGLRGRMGEARCRR